MILLIDNYDSFSHNLYQLVGSLSPDIQVVRNDAVTAEDIRRMNPSHLILSPGPGRPADAGVCEAAIRELSEELPILGVCLGHQAICAAFGGTVTYAKELMHGKQSIVLFDTDCPLFHGCPGEAPVARYHSLAMEPETLPPCLKAVASTRDGEVMAVCHRDYLIYGVQFHPESIMTPNGRQMLINFIQEVKTND